MSDLFACYLLQGRVNPQYSIFKLAVEGPSLFLRRGDEAAAFSATVIPPFSLKATICTSQMTGPSHPLTIAEAQIGHLRADLGDASVTALQAVASSFQQWAREPHGAQGRDFLANKFGSQKVRSSLAQEISVCI